MNVEYFKQKSLKKIESQENKKKLKNENGKKRRKIAIKKVFID